MKRVFISQYMGGKTTEEIIRERAKAVKYWEEKGYEIIDTIITREPPECNYPRLWYLGKSIKLMSWADVVYFLKGWENGSGCKIERAVAEEYNLKILDEGDELNG